MRASSLIPLAVLPLLATAQISNFLNLWTDHACSAPLDEIQLPATGCTNLTEFDAFSVLAAIVNRQCTSTIVGYQSFDCAGAPVVVSSPTVTTCQDAGNHAWLSFEVTGPC
ncbi:hypothetical protein AOQ84DRAFT_362049 [Glonium stellatum]|uniref:Uncharacterized protein n=1 Tax=Glonium stellatum TaxID=574774 RepID=A0A8E2F5R4_9PEZI|nr:hypothetical protein AOQ84DRAFT_362049 [Glonium stellatum]